MALRTSGHLLLGVVRIYSRKAKYLLADCNEAFVKIKMAFRPGMVDLPEENREAAVNAITLPEVFHDFDTAMPSLDDVDLQSQFTMNQTRAEEITMREDYGNINLESAADDDFGDTGLMDESASELREGSKLREASLFNDEEPSIGMEPGPSKEQSHQFEPPMMDDNDGFGPTIGGDFGENSETGVGGGGGLFDEPVMPDPEPEAEISNLQPPLEPPLEPPGSHRSVPGSYRTAPPGSMRSPGGPMSDDGFGGGASPMGPPSPMASSPGNSRPPSPMATPYATPGPGHEPGTPAPATPAQAPPTPAHMMLPPAVQEQTTLLHNEEESFALAPVDASALRGTVRTKRKRKLIVDEVKAIAGEEMKAQLSDTQDIITTLDLAPPTKRLMHWKETGGVEKLFALPGKPLHSRALFDAYQGHLVSHPTENENFGLLGDSEHDNLQLENIAGAVETEDPRTIGPKKPGRKRKEPVDKEDQPAPATPVKRSLRLTLKVPQENQEEIPEEQANKENQQPQTAEQDFEQLQQNNQ